jgi:hypothetical protein
MAVDKPLPTAPARRGVVVGRLDLRWRNLQRPAGSLAEVLGPLMPARASRA